MVESNQIQFNVYVYTCTVCCSDCLSTEILQYYYHHLTSCWHVAHGPLLL